MSEANLQLMHTAQAPMGEAQEFKEIGPYSYGMGWVITSYRGHRSIWHNGGIDGFYALLTMLPEEELAVVILTNLLNQPVPEIVAYKIYDQVLGLQAIDWSARYEEAFSKAKAAAQTSATNRKTVYTLELLKDLKFAIKGLSGYSVEFRKDSAGQVNELVVFQPDGTFVAKRKSQNKP